MPSVDDADLVAGVVAQLQARLPALADAAGLPAVTGFLDYDPPMPDPTKSPLVWVDVTGDRREDSSGRGATLQKYSHQPRLVVGIQAAGPNSSQTAFTLRRYVSLIRRAVEGDQKVGGLVLWARWMETRYSPNMSRTAAQLQKEGLLVFDLNHRNRIGQD